MALGKNMQKHKSRNREHISQRIHKCMQSTKTNNRIKEALSSPANTKNFADHKTLTAHTVLLHYNANSGYFEFLQRVSLDGSFGKRAA